MEVVTLENALRISRQLSPDDQLRLISRLSECLSGEMRASSEPVDMLSLSGLGAEIWREIKVAAYLEEERSSWDR